jgi:hypothetical protein
LGATLFRDFHSTHPEAFEGIAGDHPIGAGKFVQAGLNPLPAEPQAGNQPDDSGAFVIQQEVNKGRGFERLTLAGTNISRHEITPLFVSTEFQSLLTCLIYTFRVRIYSDIHHKKDKFCHMLV